MNPGTTQWGAHTGALANCPPAQPVFALCVRPRTLSNKNLELCLFPTYPAKKPLSTKAFSSPIKKNPW